MIIPVVLSGGSGTRLWPLSTPERPKQFLPLVGEATLFHDTLRRVDDRTRFAPPVVVGNAKQERLCADELADEPGARLIVEPIARNTAVAIVMAAALIAKSDPSAVLLVMPSDHRIADEESFQRAVDDGRRAAMKGLLVTFGIQPTGPETGYGYLEAGEPVTNHERLLNVARFKEKPDAQAAAAMLEAGGHFWNGGIFMFRADRFLVECARLAPEVHNCGVKALRSASSSDTRVHPEVGVLKDCPDISVDYAVMERSDAIAMVPLDAGWSDVGSWDALADLAGSEGASSAPALDSRNCYVRTDGLKVALLGVEDLIIVGQGDQVAIMKRGRSQDIKRLAALAAND